MILRKLKEAAESYLGDKVRKAVITVPAYFNDGQRQATKDAGQIAGLEVERIINEPTAAALAYGLDKKKNEKIAVFDLGGGTFDISILDVGDGVFEVARDQRRHPPRRRRLGRALIDYIADEFKKEQGIDLRKDQMALQRLKEAAEKAKKDLSSTHGDRHQPAVHHGRRRRAQAPAACTITRAKFEQLTDDLVERTDGAGPQKALERRQAQARARSTRSCWSAARPACPRCSRSSRRSSARSRTRASTPTRSSPSARRSRAACSRGDVKDVLLLDVTPLSLGLETKGGVMTKLDRAQHDDPDREEGDLHHGRGQPDGGRDQGAPGRAADGAATTACSASSTSRASRRRRGACRRSRSTFDIDANGILNVSAKDKATGKEQNIKITPRGGLKERDRADGKRRRGARGRGQEAPRADRGPQQARQPVYPTEKTSTSTRTSSAGRQGSSRAR